MGDKHISSLIKRCAAALFITAAASLFSSCALTKEDVKLRTKDEMTALAEERHGSVTFLREEDDVGAHVFYFIDDTYGFEFEMGSYSVSEGMDGSTFYYREGMRDKWAESYAAYLTNTAVSDINRRCEENGGRMRVVLSERSDAVYVKLHIYGDYYELEPEIKQVCGELAALNTENAFNDELNIYLEESELYQAGTYHFSTGVLDDLLTVRRESMFHYVGLVMRKEIENGEVIKCSSPEEVPGLSEVGWLTEHRDKFSYPNFDLYMYCFKADGEDYFIANVFRADTGNFYIATADGSPCDYY